MSIRYRFQLIFGLLSGAMLLVGIATIWAMGTVQHLHDTERNRFESYKLADELRQSSDDLTRMARSYAATRDNRYKLYFQDILDIRAGTVPYPEGYDGLFWDFIVAQGGPVERDGAPSALLDRMRALGFTEAELAKLAEAERESNDLVKLEAVAMNAVEGRFRDENGDFTVPGEPDRALALRLLFGEEYHTAKAGIMRPIHEFFELLEERTSAETLAIRTEHDRALQLTFLAVILTLVLIGWCFIYLRQQVVTPMAALRDNIDEFRYTRAAVGSELSGRPDEIGTIAKGLEQATEEVAGFIDQISATREELKRNEAEIREREEQIRSLLEVSPIGFALTRFDGTVILANESLKRIIGAPLGDPLTIDVAELYEDKDARGEYVNLLRRQGQVGGFETVWRRKDGERIWIRLSSKHVEFDGAPAILGWVDDISDQKRTQQGIHDQWRSLQLLHEIGEQIQETTTLEDAYQVCLDTVCRQMGWPIGHVYLVQGKSGERLMPLGVWHIRNSEGMEVFTSATAEMAFDKGEGMPGRVLETGKPNWAADIDVADDFLRADAARKAGLKSALAFPVTADRKTLAVIECFSEQRFDPDERVLSLLANVGDQLGSIILRKRAEAEISEKERLLRVTLDTMSDGIFVLDRDLNYVLFNNRYLDLMDLSRDIVTVGAPVDRAVQTHAERGDYGEGDVEELVRHRMEKLGGPDFIHSEMALESGERVVELRKAPMAGGGAVVVATDITKRKLAEARLRRSEETFRAVVNQLPASVALKDVNDMIILTNDLYEQWFIEPGDMAVGMITSEIYAETVAAEIRAIDESVKNTGKNITREMIQTFPDGNEHILHMTKFPVRDTDGTIFAIGAVDMDITERKAAEAELQSAYEVISGSIQYAARIQRSIMPEDELVSALIPDGFIFWEPRDVVGGDVYWVGTWGEGILIILGDCTGHGVPGAFMTLISMGSLERALHDVTPGELDRLLQRMHQYIQITLRQQYEGGESDDGIELAACYVEPSGTTMSFAGARSELYILEHEQVNVVKATKQGMGYRGVPYDQAYEMKLIELRDGQIFYLSTDGLIDQIGGERARSFGKRRFKELLVDLRHEALPDQAGKIRDALRDYQGDQPRRDDVSVLGFAI